MAAKLETLHLAKLRRQLEERGHLHYKLHGGMFQAGLPDVLFVAPRRLGGTMYLLEAKVARLPATVLGATLLALLDGSPVADSSDRERQKRHRHGGASPQWARFRELCGMNAALFLACFDLVRNNWLIYPGWLDPELELLEHTSPAGIADPVGIIERWLKLWRAQSFGV